MSNVFSENPVRRRMVKDVARFESQAYLHVSTWLWKRSRMMMMVSVKASVVKYEQISGENM